MHIYLFVNLSMNFKNLFITFFLYIIYTLFDPKVLFF